MHRNKLMNFHVGENVGRLDGILGELNVSALSRLLGLSLGGNDLSVLFGLGFLFIVFDNSFEESESAVGVSNVFNSDMDSLLDLSVSDLFMDDNSNRPGVDVENSSSSSVVELVRHTLVLGSIYNNIDYVADLVFLEVVLHSNGPISSEWPLKFMSGSSSEPVRSSHSL